MRKRKWSAEQIAEGVDLYRDGHPIWLVTMRTGATYREVRGWLEAAGVEVRRRGPEGLGVDRVELERLYGDGVSEREIAERLGVSRGVVFRRVCDWRVARGTDAVAVSDDVADVVAEDDDAESVVQELVEGMGESDGSGWED